jgi:glutamine amidotransferase
MGIALVDYGAGNLTSVRKGLAAAGAELIDVPGPGALQSASGIVVPGVGHFGTTAALDAAWREAIQAAIGRGTPLLGICLGMQWLFAASDEAPGVPGLEIIHETIKRMDGPAVKIPHVGWNSLELRGPSRILGGLEDGAQVYFTHSFAAPVTAETVATTTHGTTFAAAVEIKRVSGVQFHPEKSGEAGLRILRNFVACCRNA